jgi:hypothetical protein
MRAAVGEGAIVAAAYLMLLAHASPAADTPGIVVISVESVLTRPSLSPPILAGRESGPTTLVNVTVNPQRSGRLDLVKRSH